MRVNVSEWNVVQNQMKNHRWFTASRGNVWSISWSGAWFLELIFGLLSSCFSANPYVIYSAIRGRNNMDGNWVKCIELVSPAWTVCFVKWGWDILCLIQLWDVVCFPGVGIMNGYEWETFEMKLTSFRGFVIRALFTPNPSQNTNMTRL